MSEKNASAIVAAIVVRTMTAVNLSQEAVNLNIKVTTQLFSQ